MKAAMLWEPERLETVDPPLRPLRQGEVLLQVKACSICGSDLEGYHGYHPKMTYPRVMGHEVASRVAEMGPGEKEFGRGNGVDQRIMSLVTRQVVVRSQIEQSQIVGLDGVIAALVNALGQRQGVNDGDHKGRAVDTTTKGIEEILLDALEVPLPRHHRGVVGKDFVHVHSSTPAAGRSIG